MRLTKQTQYAIRVLMYCASNHERLYGLKEIASACSIPILFLAKLNKPLIENGFIKSVRGRTGGIQLAMLPKDIKLSEVIKITEDNFILAECFDRKATDCPLLNSCELNTALVEALGAFFTVLDQFTIEDITKFRADQSQQLGSN